MENWSLSLGRAERSHLATPLRAESTNRSVRYLHAIMSYYNTELAGMVLKLPISTAKLSEGPGVTGIAVELSVSTVKLTGSPRVTSKAPGRRIRACDC
jgi:hypothetical protein